MSPSRSRKADTQNLDVYRCLLLPLLLNCLIPSTHAANTDPREVQRQLWEGIRKDNPEQIVRARQQGADLNAKRDLDQMTPLGVAARDDRLEAVKELLTLGAGLEVTGGRWNATPLHYASYCGHLKVVIELVASGADASVEDGRGYTPLHNAQRWGHNDVKTYLQAVLFQNYGP